MAEYRKQNVKEIYDPGREKEKLASVRAMAKTPFGEIAMGEIFAQMMTISRRYQYQVLGSYGNKADGGFKLVENLPTAGARIVYQGVEVAYSHEAALPVFGRDADVYNVPAWDVAMTVVAEGRSASAVRPLGNSSAGAGVCNYDILSHSYTVSLE